MGGTLYPGLMVTSNFAHLMLQKLSLGMDLRHVCVFTAPVFSAFTCITSYYFAKEVGAGDWAGLYSALFMAVVPGYIQRSVAGSFDNEAVSIFALIFTFYLYVKATNTVIITIMGRKL